ncbi:MAG: glycosyltransferase family 4 protein [Patescibacteria group bacterium]
MPIKEIRLNLAGTLPPIGSDKIVHGGKVKLLHLREKFGDTWKKFNVAYFVSSGLPFAPSIWIKIYRWFGIKVVWNQNGTAYKAWAGNKADEINSLMKPMHGADYVIYQTEFTKRCSDKFLGKFQGPSEVLINPVDTKKFVPPTVPLSLEPFIVIMSGHHFESKERLRVSLEAMRELRKKGEKTKLIIIGNTQELPNEEWIEVVGKFNQEDAPALYHKAHVMLHLKILDPCPTFVLEALSCGLPVVGLMNGGMPELVGNRAGILIPAVEDFEQFRYPTPVQVANALLETKNNLQEFSKNARNQTLKFDKEIWLKRHEEIFNKLLK